MPYIKPTDTGTKFLQKQTTPAARDAILLDLNGSATGEFQFDAEL
jgi:hypothetical protein